jgi:putative CocE/NonD family hydrolase
MTGGRETLTPRRIGAHGAVLGPVLALTSVLAVSGSVAAQDAGVTDPKFPGVVCKVVQMQTRDKVNLTTYVYSPAGPAAKLPVILDRNPYGVDDACFKSGTGGTTSFWAQHGYVGIHQETRGTYNSGGKFDPNVQEANDGYDAVEWAAKQPWSNGKVAMQGRSYLGLTAWQPAIKKPPHLVAITPSITTSDPHDSWLYDNGVVLPWGSMYWAASSFMPDAIKRDGKVKGLSQTQIDQKVADWKGRVNANLMKDWLWRLPLNKFSEFGTYAPYYTDWMNHPNYAGYWASMDVEPHYKEMTLPTLSSGAWYDPFQVGTVHNYLGMRAKGGSALARNGARLVMQAYGHSGDSKTPTQGSDTFDADYQLRFFDFYVKGLNNGFDKEPRVQLYIMVPPDKGNTGSGFWFKTDDFPIAGTTYQKYYLNSDGKANTRNGAGTLAVTAPSTSAADAFTYDPKDPVPTVGGNYLNNPALQKAGAADQSTVEMRGDVLVYTSAPLDRDLPVVGPVAVNFWATSSAVDTDFTAKLVDVHVDGFAQNVLDRVVRARFRAGHKLPPKLITPGQAYEYKLELGYTGIVIPKGHRLRLEISSSNFPRVSRNLNTGADNPNAESKIVVAHQTILHDATHASYLEVPVAASVKIPGR